MQQPGFFGLDERYAKLNERDPLVKPSSCINYPRKRALFRNSRSKASFALISGSHPR